MYDKENKLIDSYTAGRMSRRELFKGLGALGLSTSAAAVLVNASATRALAQNGFDWKKHEGTTVRLLLNQHPYTDAMIANLENFKELTGMDVEYDVFPEDVYFDKVTAALASGSSEYDAFMTGAYMTWTYGPAGWVEDLIYGPGDTVSGKVAVVCGGTFRFRNLSVTMKGVARVVGALETGSGGGLFKGKKRVPARPVDLALGGMACHVRPNAAYKAGKRFRVYIAGTACFAEVRNIHHMDDGLTRIGMSFIKLELETQERIVDAIDKAKFDSSRINPDG